MPQMIIRRMRFASWIPTPTNTHSQYVILIAFPLQQRLHGRLSMLSPYVHCLSCSVPQRMRKYMAVLLFLVQGRFCFNLINRTQISITVQQLHNSKIITIQFRCHNHTVFTAVQYQHTVLCLASRLFAIKWEEKQSPVHTHTHTHTHTQTSLSCTFLNTGFVSPTRTHAHTQL